MKTNVIIVDDIDINRFLLKEYLRYLPIGFMEATNGQECIDIINDSTKLIFMDVMIPVLNGIEATKIIKTKYPHIIVIGITGQCENEEHKIFDAVLYKPYRSIDLINLINKFNIVSN
jgi:CheY-like chemotaxis protein